MKVAKWGNSLALRIPTEIAQELKLTHGDDIEIEVLGKRKFGVRRNNAKELAVEKLKELGWFFPANFKFDREEANER